MSHSRSRIRWLATAAALLSLAACQDQNGSRDGGLPTNAGAGLYPQITVTGGPSAVKAELALRQIPGGLSFASYQGELVFDPQVLTLQDVTLPAGVEGVANQVSPGHVRFSGTALDGTPGAQMLILSFTAKGEVRREAFSVSFEEVSDAAEFTDLTGQVQGGYLIFQRR